jgi:glycerol-1-phosphate dehydrogenase [NAD(P)+]
MTSKERIEKALSISTDTKVFEMGNGVSSMAPEVFKNCFPGRKAVIVADMNTWAVLGEAVYGYMTQAGIPTDKYIIEKEEFHAD